MDNFILPGDWTKLISSLSPASYHREMAEMTEEQRVDELFKLMNMIKTMKEEHLPKLNEQLQETHLLSMKLKLKIKETEIMIKEGLTTFKKNYIKYKIPECVKNVKKEEDIPEMP